MTSAQCLAMIEVYQGNGQINASLDPNNLNATIFPLIQSAETIAAQNAKDERINNQVAGGTCPSRWTVGTGPNQ